MSGPRTSIVIAGLDFGPEGSVVITYMDAVQDQRNRGLLTVQHTMQVLPGDGGKDYGEEIEDVRDAAMRLLRDALEDFAHTPPASEDAAAGDDRHGP